MSARQAWRINPRVVLAPRRDLHAIEVKELDVVASKGAMPQPAAPRPIFQPRRSFGWKDAVKTQPLLVGRALQVCRPIKLHRSRFESLSHRAPARTRALDAHRRARVRLHHLHKFSQARF